jgi:anti-sigma regulatory factor (Ser/Thr protein kinase)
MRDLSLHILDIAENGINAGADLVRITVEEDIKADSLTIVIEDNGRGMEPEFLLKALDPFVTTRANRKVGLGLPLLQQSARLAEGDIKIDSTPGVGTKVLAFMKYGHIDRKPMGNMSETMVTLIQGNPEVDFVYVHRRNTKEYQLDTRELRTELEEIPLNRPEVVTLINNNLSEGLEELAANVRSNR